MLLKKPYDLEVALWSLGVALLKIELDNYPDDWQPSKRLHATRYGNDGESIILESTFNNCQLTDVYLADTFGITELQIKNKWQKLGADWETGRIAATERLIKQWSSRVARFVWITDTHIEVQDRYGDGEPAGTIARINTYMPNFVICTGDLVGSQDIMNYQMYNAEMSNLNAALYNLPGNHDQIDGAMENYQFEIGAIRWAFSVGNWRFIGIPIWEATGLTGQMSQSERDLLEIELQNASELTPIIFAHYPLLPNFLAGANIDDGNTETTALLRQYGVVAWFSGHTHMPTQAIIVDGTTHINGDALLPESTNPNSCGMMICDVYDNRIEIDYVRGSSPWDSLGTVTVWRNG